MYKVELTNKTEGCDKNGQWFFQDEKASADDARADEPGERDASEHAS